jgi:hypothetical protein
VEFFKDGTANLSGPLAGNAASWKVENGRLHITLLIGPTFLVGPTFSHEYKTSGSTLTLTYDDGQVEVFTKQK